MTSGGDLTAADEVSGAIKALGGPEVLGRPIDYALDIHLCLESGLRVWAVDHMAARYDLTEYCLAELVGTLPPTARRRRARVLTPGESDRAWKAARLLVRAEAILGSRAKAAHWIQEPCRALGAEKPMNLTSTQVGFDEAMSVLGRLADGVRT